MGPVAALSSLAVQAIVNTHYVEEYHKDHYWISNTEPTYRYQVDSVVNGFRIHGKLIIGEQDTLLTNSYEKGNSYPTWYKSDSNKMLFMRWHGIFDERLTIRSNEDLSIEFDVDMIKTPKN